MTAALNELTPWILTRRKAQQRFNEARFACALALDLEAYNLARIELGQAWRFHQGASRAARQCCESACAIAQDYVQLGQSQSAKAVLMDEIRFGAGVVESKSAPFLLRFQAARCMCWVQQRLMHDWPADRDQEPEVYQLLLRAKRACHELCH